MFRLICLLAALPAYADTVVAARTIRPEEIVTASDIVLSTANSPGAYGLESDVIGQEARVVLYAGRPIRRGDVRTPAVVGRNALVALVYSQGGLEISAEGRALDRGAVGDLISVLNTSSRNRVMGRVQPDGRVIVE